MSSPLTVCTTPACRAGAAARRWLAASLILGLGLGLVAAPGSVAAAPSRAATKRAVNGLIELNKMAITDHAAGRHEAAAKVLDEALALASRTGLAEHDMAARTHVHLGIVLISGLGHREQGLRQFARARAIKPDIQLTKQLATPELLAALDESSKVEPAAIDNAGKPKEATTGKQAPAAVVASAPAPPPEDMEPDVPVNVPQPLYCPVPIEGPPQADVRLHCLTQQDVPARKVMLFYRPGDGETYTALPMSRTKKGWFSAVIPARQVTGRALQFYFEARGDADAVAAANGRGEMPNVLVLKDGAPPVGVGALAALTFDSPDGNEEEIEEETPLEVREKAEQEAEEEAQLNRRSPGSLFVGLGVGSGYGWHMRRPLENHRSRQVSPGFSSVGLAHLAPEIGFQLTRRLSLSLQSRHQYLPPSGSGDPEVSRGPPRAAHAIMVRAQYAFLDLGNLQLVGTLVAGYGSALRMRVEPAPRAGLISSDTIVAGPGVGGPGLAFAYNLTRNLIAALEGRALVGLPRFGALFEGTGGLQYAF